MGAGAPESEGEGSVDLEGLQSEHAEALQALKARMRAEGVQLTEAATVGSPEHTLRRFLVSCDWDVAAALEKVRRMLAWRAENDIDTILERVLPEEKLAFLRGEMPTSHHGFDLRGNPVHLEQPGLFRWGAHPRARGQGGPGPHAHLPDGVPVPDPDAPGGPAHGARGGQDDQHHRPHGAEPGGAAEPPGDLPLQGGTAHRPGLLPGP